MPPFVNLGGLWIDDNYLAASLRSKGKRDAPLIAILCIVVALNLQDPIVINLHTILDELARRWEIDIWSIDLTA